MSHERPIAWRHSLGAGLLLGLALGCAWVGRWTLHWIPRLAWLVVAATLALLGLGLMLAASEQWKWLAGWRRRWGSASFSDAEPARAGASFPFFLTLALLALAAITSGNNLLYLILSGLLAAALLSGVTAALDLSGLELNFQLPHELFANQPLVMEFQLLNAKAWCPAFSVMVSAACAAAATIPNCAAAMQPVYFPYLPRRGRVAASSPLAFPRRGRYGGAAFVCSTRFPFGLMPKRRRFQAHQQSNDMPGLLVYPSPVEGLHLPRQALRSGNERPSAHRGEGQELHRIRGHQPGDSARLVDWKASARTGVLHVREYTDDSALRMHLRLALAPGLNQEQAEHAMSECAGWLLAAVNAGVWLEFTGEQASPDGRGLHLSLAPAAQHRRAVLAYLAEADATRAAVPATRVAPSAATFELLVDGN